MKKKKRTNPEPVAQVSARMKPYRARKKAERTANRLHLAAHGWDGDAESFITAWRNGINEVNWKPVKENET
jgi:hypothetical protein